MKFTTRQCSRICTLNMHYRACSLTSGTLNPNLRPTTIIPNFDQLIVCVPKRPTRYQIGASDTHSHNSKEKTTFFLGFETQTRGKSRRRAAVSQMMRREQHHDID